MAKMRSIRDDLDKLKHLTAEWYHKEVAYLEKIEQFTDPDGLSLEARNLEELSKLAEAAQQARKECEKQLINIWKRLA